MTGSQQEIDRLLVERARAGRLVVRLKGGDPFVFGRGGEEVSACRAAGVDCEVVPGITSALAAPAFAGIPVTDRRHAASFAVVTGHRDPGRPWTSIRFDQVAAGADTLVVLMGMKNLEKIVEAIASGGRGPETPAAVVMEGGTPRQRVVVAPLGEIVQRTREAGLLAPAVIVVGEVVQLREELSCWERQPLFGRRILVTRPALQSEPWAAALRAAGAEPVSIPLIATRTVAGPDLGPSLEAADALVFTSANAARHLAERLRAAGREPSAGRARVLCVGAATAAAARRYGFADPEVATVRADAASLAIAIEERLAPRGRRFLVPHGSLGSDTLIEHLRAAGAEVEAALVYETVAAEVDAAALRAALVAGDLDACTFASPSAARRFAALLDAPARAGARRTVIAAIGATTAAALRELELPPAVVPERADAHAMVDALAEHFATRGRGGAR